MNHFKRTIKTFFSVAIIVSAVLGSARFVSAGTGLSIQPVKVSHTLEAGQSVSGTISLKNASEESVKVEVKVEDFVPTAGSSGIKFVGRADGVTTVRDWVTIGGNKTFVLRKGESKKIPYTIKAPADAEPGSHFGVAFFKATKPDQADNQLKIGAQVGMLIFVTVPGNFLQKGEILDFSAPAFVQQSPVVFNIKFKNTGTVHFEPKGEIKITNIFGKEVGRIPVSGQAVLPTGVRDLVARWDVSDFLVGRYKADLTMTDGEGNVLTANSVVFYALPLWHIVGFVLSVIILFYALKFLRNKVNISVSFKK